MNYLSLFQILNSISEYGGPVEHDFLYYCSFLLGFIVVIGIPVLFIILFIYSIIKKVKIYKYKKNHPILPDNGNDT